MATNIKNAILKKKIDGIVYDLMVKTQATMVYVDDTTTLSAKLTELQASIAENTSKLAELMGEGEGGSIAEQINTAIEELRQAIEDEATPGAIGYRVKAVEDAIAAINHETTGILATSKAYTDAQIAAKLASTYKAAGSVAFAELPTLDATQEGKVYNVTDAFSTTADFVEGADKKYPAGTNVVCIEVEVDTYKWDVLAGMVDLSAYETAEVTTQKIATAKQEAIDAAAADATSKADAAKAGAEATAAAALGEYKTEVTAALGTKGRFYASETEPEGLTENDLWACIVTE